MAKKKEAARKDEDLHNLKILVDAVDEVLDRNKRALQMQEAIEDAEAESTADIPEEQALTMSSI